MTEVDKREKESKLYTYQEAKNLFAQETTRELSEDKLKLVIDSCRGVGEKYFSYAIRNSLSVAIKQAHQAGELWEER